MGSPLDRAKGHEVVWHQVAPLFETARLFADASFVYVIGEADDGAVKIGVAKDPVSRLRAMQTGNPRRLRVEYVLLGTARLERLLHELWEPLAIISASNVGKVDVPPGTEWFAAEIRPLLFPILATAVDLQLDHIADGPDPTFDGLELAVRKAHQQHDFVARGRDAVRLLAQGSGYAIRRPSRI